MRGGVLARELSAGARSIETEVLGEQVVPADVTVVPVPNAGESVGRAEDPILMRGLRGDTLRPWLRRGRLFIESKLPCEMS